MYHTIGRSIFSFLEALLTFEQVSIVYYSYFITVLYKIEIIHFLKYEQVVIHVYIVKGVFNIQFYKSGLCYRSSLCQGRVNKFN